MESEQSCTPNVTQLSQPGLNPEARIAQPHPPLLPDSPRYTQAFDDQPARDRGLYGRDFYMAGERLDGSVIQHHPGSEAMVIDFEKDHDLRDFYDQCISEYDQAKDVNAGLQFPSFIYNKIQQRMQYNLGVVEGLVTGTFQAELRQHGDLYDEVIKRAGKTTADEAANLPPFADEKVQLGIYFRLGYGVCRQQAAAEAAMLERAIDEGRAPLWKAVELRANMASPLSGHAWAAGLHENGQTYVWDPAQGYTGIQEKANNWLYGYGYENHQFGKPGT